MNLKSRIRRAEKQTVFDTPKIIDVTKLSDAELEAMINRDAKFAELLKTLSDAELSALADDDLNLLSTETLLQLRNLWV